MAQRRGMGNGERFALDMVTVTADASLVLGACFVYSMVCGLIDVSASGSVVLADSTASGSCDNESAKIEVKLGAGAVSAGAFNGVFSKDFNPPIYVQKTLVADITNATVSVTYVAAS